MAKVEGTQFGAGLTWSSDPYQGVDVRVGQSAPGVTDRAYAVTDNTVVVSNEVDVVHQVIDTIGGRASSLAGEATYKETLDGLPKSVLGLAYVNFPEAMSLALQGAAAGGSSAIYASPSPTAFAASASNQVANPFDQLKAFKGLGITLSAQKAGLALDVALDVDRSRLSPQQQAAFSSEPRPAEVLRSVPGSAYGVLAISGFKQFVQSFLAQAQQNPAFGAILGRLDLGSVVNELSGQAALEVGSGPTRAPAGAVLIGTNDTAGMQGFLDNVAKQIVSSSAPGGPTGFRTQVYKGIAIHSANVASLQGSGLAPSYAVANGFGILGTSAAEIKAVIDAPSGASMSEAPTFRDAESQVPQGNSIAYLDVQGLLHALGPSLADMFGSQFSLVEPNLEPLKAFIATGETAGNVVKSHVFLLIR